MVKPAGSDFREKRIVLFCDDFVDLVLERGTVEEACVVGPPGRDDLSGSVDNGFHIVRGGALILCLYMEGHSFLFNFRVDTRHFLFELPGKAAKAFCVFSGFFSGIAACDQPFSRFISRCRYKKHETNALADCVFTE